LVICEELAGPRLLQVAAAGSRSMGAELSAGMIDD
jgi:hypothetical protein